ncbi:bifunctional methylenetetrahydrofolate dehydrogenase/methenyltetrahydrofolate cyclohydrolase [Halalkalibacillus sediminis]|uniref:Bifunctional protein FolD n=1 Tax=Halalkalibacillus sediminis TaxID=2018042 RepID=A0A2I0QX85_9BACI|nr:tetrahydrofolate dehydrogenase/cyclohydrolase catalytic domain-containing protein [Halalkalibacillus sediminis]PKR78953.1 bifunctional methylenetetrahydrofolate dehydrogenase/methenyltetrahydrofolate cyclohydrolase [Halalkalibacillus sediminis]
MSATIMYGKDVAEDIRNSLYQEVEELKKEGIKPGLVVVIVGNDKASKTYVRMKEKAAINSGMFSKVIEKDESLSEEELLNTIHSLNNDNSIHGILVQLPLPDHIDEQKVLESIDPSKDVDGFHPINIGRLMVGEETFVPCTPYGIIKMLEHHKIPIEGKHAVIIGRSNIVGKPMGQLLLNRDATVTYCHSKTAHLRQFTKQADILIVAIGKAHVIGAEDVKEGSAIFDVGNSFTEDGKVLGDVDYDRVVSRVNYITPVPKGIGPMTITMLLHNTVHAAKSISKGA